LHLNIFDFVLVFEDSLFGEPPMAQAVNPYTLAIKNAIKILLIGEGGSLL